MSIHYVNKLATLDGSKVIEVKDLLSTSDLSGFVDQAYVNEAVKNRVIYTSDMDSAEALKSTLAQGQALDVRGSSLYFDGSAFQVSESLSVKSFGAKGDGVTNDTVAFRKALVWASGSGSGRKLVIPAGRYILKQSIQINGNQCNCYIEGAGSSITELIWASDSTSAGLVYGKTTPITRLFVRGITTNTKIATSNPSIEAHFTGTSQRQMFFSDILSYGDGLVGTPANGYFGGGCFRCYNVSQPIAEDIIFYGVDGSKANFLLVPFGCLIESSSQMGLIPHLINVSCSNVGYSHYISTINTPGIEGVIFDRCNGFCVYGLKVTAQDASNPAYYPPQCNVNNTQIEFMETGMEMNHIAAVTMNNSTLLQHPNSNTTGAAMILVDVKTALVLGTYAQARPGLQMDGIRVMGSSTDVVIAFSDIEVPSGHTAIVFEGASRNCRQLMNRVKGGGTLYVNSSSFKGTNTTEAYNTGDEISAEVSDGYIIKQGSRIVPVDANGEFTINFVTPFPNSLVSVVPASGEAGAYNGSISLATQNGFGFVGRVTGVSQGIEIRVNYTASGS